jgi:hypothetical protein
MAFGSARTASIRRFNARRACVDRFEVKETLDKGGFIQERPA